MRKHFRPSTIIATVALVFALAGTSYAASTYLITSTNQIAPNVLKNLKGDRGPRGYTGAAGAHGATGLTGSSGPSGSNGLTGAPGATGTAGPTGATGATGMQGERGYRGEPGPEGDTGAPGTNGSDGTNGATGATGATGAVGPAELESSRSCTPTLCIDADPNSGGSGGWGWDNVLNAAVTDLTVGQTYPFTVTVVQDGSPNADGSITLTWNPTDFTGPTAGSDGSAVCATASTGNAVSCTYTDLARQYKSDSFNFTALHDNPDAQVGVTVEVNGEEASALFPVAITG
jgi:hypothetical protein